MTKPTQLMELAAKHRGTTPEMFKRHEPGPFLLSTMQPFEDEGQGFQTQRRSREDIRRPRTAEYWVYRLTKKNPNAFAGMVTVGRADNNDLRLPDSLVSKFHCYFSEVAGTWTITDAGSANGTSVDGSPLVKGEPRALQAGSRIVLSEALVFDFSTADDLYVRLKAASGG